MIGSSLPHSVLTEQRFFSGGGENVLILWDVASGQPLQQLEGHTTFIYNAKFSPDGNYALSSSAGGEVILWDIANNSEIQRFTEHTDDVRDITFNGTGSVALTASGDNTVRMWRILIETEAIINWMQENRYIRAFTCGERNLFGVGEPCPTPTPIFDDGAV